LQLVNSSKLAISFEVAFLWESQLGRLSPLAHQVWGAAFS